LILFRDLKLENIIVEEQVPFHVKLLDFGNSAIQNSSQFMNEVTGSKFYMAPEIYL